MRIGLDVDGFLSQEKIIVLKHDKKSKAFIEKDVKDMVESIEVDGNHIKLVVACGSNKTLNPTNLLKALFDYSGFEYKSEDFRITRTKLILE